MRSQGKGAEVPRAFEASVSQRRHRPAAQALPRHPEAGRRVDVVGFERFASIEAGWRALAGLQDRPVLYQSFDWCHPWVKACAGIGRPLDVRVVTVREEGRLVLVWPLALSRLGPIRILHALGEPATQYCDLLVEPGACGGDYVDLAWDRIAAMPDVDLVHLRNVREGSGLDLLRRICLRKFQRSADAAPYLRLGSCEAGSVGDGPRDRSSRSRNALRRHRKQLARLGPVTFEVVDPCDHRMAAREALALKRAWLETRGTLSAGYAHPANEPAIEDLAEAGRFAVTRLRVGAATAAIEIGLVEAGHYYSLIQSYDQAFAAHAPGRLLIWQFIEENPFGIETMDFLPPSLPHKTEWTDASVPVREFAVPLTSRGRLALPALRRLKGGLKRLHAALPLPLRRRLLRLAGAMD